MIYSVELRYNSWSSYWIVLAENEEDAIQKAKEASDNDCNGNVYSATTKKIEAPFNYGEEDGSGRTLHFP